MAFPLKAQKVNYHTLEEASGLTPKNFKALWSHVRGKLLEPENGIGFLGASKCGSDRYRIWLNSFISGGIGRLGWGNGVTEWDYGCEEDQAQKAERRRQAKGAKKVIAGKAVSTKKANSKVRGRASRTGTGHLVAQEQSALASDGTLASPLPVEAALPPAAAQHEVGQQYELPSELPAGAPVIFVDRASTTFAEFLDIVATECPRPKSRVASAIISIRVFVGSQGDFIDVIDGSNWDQVKQLLPEGLDTPGLNISVEFD